MTPHTLRDRQLATWAGLEKGPAAIVAFVLMFATWVIAHTVWFPLIDNVLGIDLPDFLKQTLVAVAIAAQFFPGLGNVPAGTETAQKFMGKYTGVSFSPGIYLLPRLPFPLITLLLSFGGSELAKYFVGWMLEDAVTVNDRTLKIEVVGLTKDKRRVKLTTVVLYRIAEAATYLYQTKVNTDEQHMLESINAQSVANVKSQLVARYDLEPLYQGQLQNEEELGRQVSEACGFLKDYGIRVIKVLATTVDILDKNVQKMFDISNAADLAASAAGARAKAIAAFKANYPDATENEILALFPGSQGDGPAVKIDIVNLK